jgi:hypothetical protein
MIGKLHKKGDHWVIRYKMEDDTVATDGGELSIHPDTPIEIFAQLTETWKDELQGKEVEFEIVNFMHDTFVANIIDEDYESPEPNEALKSAKIKFDASVFIPPSSLSDDFQIDPDGDYENVDEWDPDYMDGKNHDTWFDEMDINPQWKKHLKKYNLSQEIWNVIVGLYVGETHSLRKSLEEQKFWALKYHKLNNQIKDLLD